MRDPSNFVPAHALRGTEFPRSTKAGGGTPATRIAGQWQVVEPLRRSTKAGGGTPATPPPPASPFRNGTRAQRRPEVELRQHERNQMVGRGSVNAQRRPEVELRQHPAPQSPAKRPCAPLNEGRRWNSGNTPPNSVSLLSANRAQRRPEVELRQHYNQWGYILRNNRALNEGRRWNSGNTPNFSRLTIWAAFAQRRPEVELRQHGPPGG